MNFEKFPKIENINRLQITITQKIDGTNAHIIVSEDGVVQAASRNRFIYPHDDNYGFAAYVEENKEEIFEKLGPGRHDGEWAGPGINSSEGLKERHFILFDFWKHPPEKPLPPRMKVVPVLYNGPLKAGVLDDTMEDLKVNGSKLVRGFMRPEGMVITIAGTRFKKVFRDETAKWSKDSSEYVHLCQPLRLEKLLSKDERYIATYPKSLPLIVKDYINDLVEEGQISGDAASIKAIKKRCTSTMFLFIKTSIEERTSI